MELKIGPHQLDDLKTTHDFKYFNIRNGKAKYHFLTLANNGCGLYYALRLDDDGYLTARRAVEPDTILRCHVELKPVDSWNKKIWTTDIPYSFEDGVMIIPDDWDSLILKLEPEHVFVMFELNDNAQSKNLALWVDDNIEGFFSYRDWTSNGLPFNTNGNTYWAGFTFQKLVDAKKLQQKFGGNGNWMEDHLEFVENCNNKRNKR